MTSKWTKHAALTRPAIGKYHRFEIALMGAPCGIIKEWAAKFAQSWHQEKTAFLDMEHHPEARLSPYYQLWNHQQSYFDLQSDDFPSDFALKIALQENDRLLINGNHFLGAQQVVFIDPKKNVAKHAEKLTAPLMVIIREGVDEIPEAIQSKLQADTPVFKEAQEEEILNFIQAWSLLKKAPLKGLVLTGGKSQRMGEDKSQQNYTGKKQWEKGIELLKPFCQEVFISCNAQQKEQYPGQNLIIDRFLGLGPMGGILSAFQADPDAAWLVIAVDLPLLNEQTLSTLVEHRQSGKVATCFKIEDRPFPEPLITIYEPRAYVKLLQYMSLGYSCPRKLVINENCEVIPLADGTNLTNANTPGDKAEILKNIQP
ncbi:NTP transferase domain-containing protein [Persicobacter diffluens]|uniref:Probable molybdenum cofactor guanylyltransferase n=1 Tax=Persicobacter diffluens TaxID=981 RepID=A0AAN4VZM2_9BACT|nr:hypothetical protein PEDI_32300 [Persicobacter diffluens]